MRYQGIFFDLDGTLLPMDQDLFVKYYFGSLAKKLAPLGYEPDQLVSAIWQGTRAMVKNDGSKTNEQVFWDCFAALFGEKARQDEPRFEEFYRTDFVCAKAACVYTEKAAQLVKTVKEKGLRCALATNPIFPDIATSQRMEWAGLSKGDFELYTTYENARHCKPNPAYYLDILEKMGLEGSECVMIGNDAVEDVAARQVGMQVFLIDDCLLNGDKADMDTIPHGNFDDAIRFVKAL